MADLSERCRWKCPGKRKPKQLLCRDCWYRLSPELRERINAARWGSDAAQAAVTEALTIARTWWADAPAEAS